MKRRVGILTGGGDAPGLNAVIRAFVKRGAGQLGWEVLGIEDSFDGLLPERPGICPLTPIDCQGLLQKGGTILGTTNRGDPFAFPGRDGTTSDRSADIAAGVRAAGLEGLVVVGGDGTQRIAWRLMQERGIPVIGVPKTIDDDLEATDVTFGFRSAVDVATEALDRLHTTAESHDRVLVLEVMGRDAGHIALEAGVAGGADVILIPEIPWSPERVASKIHRRRAVGRAASLVIVAEGACPLARPGEPDDPASRRRRVRGAGGAGALVVKALAAWVEAEARVCVLGHLQRGGSPIPFDRVLATRFGVGAVDLVAAGRWGELVALRGDRVVGVPLEEAVRGQRLVDPHGELVRVARAVGVEFGG
jgi:6-phosphofructokinase 1